MRWLNDFIARNSSNNPMAKFKCGQRVTFIDNGVTYKGKILALARSGDTFEYAVSGVLFLLWESELKDGSSVYRTDVFKQRGKYLA